MPNAKLVLINCGKSAARVLIRNDTDTAAEHEISRQTARTHLDTATDDDEDVKSGCSSARTSSVILSHLPANKAKSDRLLPSLPRTGELLFGHFR